MAGRQQSMATWNKNRINRYRWTHEAARQDITIGKTVELLASASDDYRVEEIYKFMDDSKVRVTYSWEKRYGQSNPSDNGIFEIVVAAVVKV